MAIEKTKSGAYSTLKRIVDIYSTVLPKQTYPWVMLSIAACAVFFSWFGGNYLFHNYGLLPRMFFSWMITAFEYSFLLPGIGGSVEVLGYSQNSLAVIVHAIQLIAYIILNRFTTEYAFKWRHMVAFALIFVAVLLIAYEEK
jgi:uncharacterized protein (DUF486 family)